MKLVLALVYQLRPRAGRQSLSLHRFAAGACVGCFLNRLMRLRSYETCFAIGLLASPPCGAAVTLFAAAKKVTKESSFSVIQCQDVTTLESSRVARPSECPPLFVVRIGTRTHCALATPKFVVRQSSLRPRFAPTHGAPQPLASFHSCVYLRCFALSRNLLTIRTYLRRARSAKTDE